MKRRLFPLLLALLCAQASALDISDARRYVCKQGGCVNGPGVVYDAYLQLQIKGTFAGGHTVPGASYSLSSARAPGQTFTQVYGQDGMLEQGDQPRSVGFSGPVPFFRGSYSRIDHPFMKMRIPVPREGVYDTGIGIEYRGRFEFIAAKSGMHTSVGSGFYIFFGDKVDLEDKETLTGLFVSGETLAGAPIMFAKAEPSYLAVLQQRYQRDMQIAQSDFREKESEQKWRSVLAVVGKLAFAIASGGTNLSNMKSLGGDLVMGMVSDMMNQQQNNVDLKASALRAARAVQAEGEDKALTDALSQAVSEGISASQ